MSNNIAIAGDSIVDRDLHEGSELFISTFQDIQNNVVVTDFPRKLAGVFSMLNASLVNQSFDMAFQSVHFGPLDLSIATLVNSSIFSSGSPSS